MKIHTQDQRVDLPRDQFLLNKGQEWLQSIWFRNGNAESSDRHKFIGSVDTERRGNNRDPKDCGNPVHVVVSESLKGKYGKEMAKWQSEILTGLWKVRYRCGSLPRLDACKMEANTPSPFGHNSEMIETGSADMNVKR
jgi:hypothetical protein